MASQSLLLWWWCVCYRAVDDAPVLRPSVDRVRNDRHITLVSVRSCMLAADPTLGVSKVCVHSSVQVVWMSVCTSMVSLTWLCVVLSPAG